jgi:hypothetical protein
MPTIHIEGKAAEENDLELLEMLERSSMSDAPCVGEWQGCFKGCDENPEADHKFHVKWDHKKDPRCPKHGVRLEFSSTSCYSHWHCPIPRLARDLKATHGG